MKYIDYHNMKEFCTIAEVCHLFEMDKKKVQNSSGTKPGRCLWFQKS